MPHYPTRHRSSPALAASTTRSKSRDLPAADGSICCGIAWDTSGCSPYPSATLSFHLGEIPLSHIGDYASTSVLGFHIFLEALLGALFVSLVSKKERQACRIPFQPCEVST